MGERKNAELNIVGPLNVSNPNRIGTGDFQAKLLHVEDHDIVSRMTKEMLECEGWEVETCSDGEVALEKISGQTRYDLLLFDYDLPGMNGLALVRRSRKLAHRSQTPIVVLSATPLEAAARHAGADVFLLKPQDIGKLVETIMCLVSKDKPESGSA